jgi:molecular chaperone DnaK (HSP70)
MAREYVPIFFEWLEVTQDLTQEQKGNLIDAAVLYASGGDWERVLTGVEIIAFRFIKGQIDRNNAISDARSKAGSNKREQTITNDNKPKQTETKLPKEKEKEKEKDKEKDKEKENAKPRFAPPTIEQVRDYCRERGKGVNPERWFNYYESNGWKVGRNPMKDWKAAVRSWETNGGGNQTAPPMKKVAAQQYSQRDYNGEAENMDDVLNRLKEGMAG